MHTEICLLNQSLGHLFSPSLSMQGVAMEGKTQIELKKNKDFLFHTIISQDLRQIEIRLRPEEVRKWIHQ
jgi:anthranilate/para-aminobenzoate synthase component II